MSCVLLSVVFYFLLSCSVTLSLFSVVLCCVVSLSFVGCFVFCTVVCCRVVSCCVVSVAVSHLFALCCCGGGGSSVGLSWCCIYRVCIAVSLFVLLDVWCCGMCAGVFPLHVSVLFLYFVSLTSSSVAP